MDSTQKKLIILAGGVGVLAIALWPKSTEAKTAPTEKDVAAAKVAVAQAEATGASPDVIATLKETASTVEDLYNETIGSGTTTTPGTTNYPASEGRTSAQNNVGAGLGLTWVEQRAGGVWLGRAGSRKYLVQPDGNFTPTW